MGKRAYCLADAVEGSHQHTVTKVDDSLVTSAKEMMLSMPLGQSWLVGHWLAVRCLAV